MTEDACCGIYIMLSVYIFPTADVYDGLSLHNVDKQLKHTYPIVTIYTGSN